MQLAANILVAKGLKPLMQIDKEKKLMTKNELRSLMALKFRLIIVYEVLPVLTVVLILALFL